jgi:hypothetical protein
MGVFCKKRRNQWQYWILATVSRCCSWCTAWNRYGRNFSCFVARWALVTDKHLCVPKFCYQSVCCLIRYFLVRICVTECFTNSSKRFRYEENVREWTHVLLVNKPCSHLHSFCATGVSSGLATRWPWLECHGGGWESLLHGGGPASDIIFVP